MTDNKEKKKPKGKTKKTSKFVGGVQEIYGKKSDATLFGSKDIFGLRPIDIARYNVGTNFSEIDLIKTNQLGFSTRALVQANLPHSEPDKTSRVWVRKNGNYSLVIQSGITVDKEGEDTPVGIPYGNIPRVVLLFLCSEAIRTKSREINLGNNLSSFLRELGLYSSGGEKGDITRFKEQMKRLVASRIQFQYNDRNSDIGFDASIAKRYFFFWDDDPEQSTLFDNKIVLDADFYEEIISSRVPIHLGAITALKSSSFALDLYTWLTYRVSYLEDPVPIKWKELEQQTGADYSDIDNFRKRAVKVLGDIKKVWSDLEYEIIRGGFTLKPCKPSVPVTPKPKKRLTS